MLYVSQHISERDLDNKILMISCFSPILALSGSQKVGREIYWDMLRQVQKIILSHEREQMRQFTEDIGAYSAWVDVPSNPIDSTWVAEDACQH